MDNRDITILKHFYTATEDIPIIKSFLEKQVIK